ncbi:16S rRNA (guanine(527)-N(7))-methyltransferase RsmG [Shimia marina]|uniref:Ribosomal RNA small subunit methyltransferase G n=1 Tax=Shimia marina TaxID=321267 RepID=A0A0P1EMK7_9RHOB|nr:16S rRNA (guanine(527)-N(7))-methyltransferase RsmG [Shimia marina]CUH51471.1 Ribosomal RNA small subunit methyltransferase G [Shimia marina]SFD48247.1 16S rRNA (guanine527-N7)-methyltransferase [Shimia marina]
MSCPDTVKSQLNVSRETLDRLETLADLLQKWNPRINLVSKSTLKDLWTRHILDSVQVLKSAPANADHWVDIGSGGGFPGLVIALMQQEPEAPKKVTLIESDQRKCAFLRTVLRETGVQATVISERIEKATPQNADVLSARALADLSLLFDFAERHLKASGQAVFPKGARWEKEVETAQKSWSFECQVVKSITDPEAVILKVGEIKRVGSHTP